MHMLLKRVHEAAIYVHVLTGRKPVLLEKGCEKSQLYLNFVSCTSSLVPTLLRGNAYRNKLWEEADTNFLKPICRTS